MVSQKRSLEQLDYDELKGSSNCKKGRYESTGEQTGRQSSAVISSTQSWRPNQATQDAITTIHDALKVVLSSQNIASLIGLCGEEVASTCADLKTVFKRIANEIHSNQYQTADHSVNVQDSMLLGASDWTLSGHRLPPLPPIRDAKIRNQAFTHSSIADGQNSRERYALSYERLEHLGDAYLQTMATKMLFAKYPRATDGRLSRLRQNLVRNTTLAKFTSAYKLDKQLLINPEQKRLLNDDSWTKIRGDLFEAYIGALIISSPDNGEKIVEAWLRELWTEQVINGDWLTMIAPREFEEDAKNELAKKVLGVGVKLRYEAGKPPRFSKAEGVTTYFLDIYLDGWGYDSQLLGRGEGISKKSATSRAAAAALRNHPLIDQIMSKKLNFDAATRIERAKLAKEREATEKLTVDHGSEEENPQHDTAS